MIKSLFLFQLSIGKILVAYALYWLVDRDSQNGLYEAPLSDPVELPSSQATGVLDMNSS